MKPFIEFDNCSCFFSYYFHILIGEVTDVRLVKSSDGKSRMFAFVGFRHEIQAQAALNHFHNTFLGTVRIAVEKAKKVGDKDLPKYNRIKSTRGKQTAEPIVAENLVEVKSKSSESTTLTKADQSKLDFLEAMKPRGQAQKWGNDESKVVSSGLPTAAKNAEDSDEEDEYQEVIAPSLSVSSTFVAKTETETAAKSADLAYLRSKVRSDFEFSEDEDDDDNDDEDEDDEDEQNNNLSTIPTTNSIDRKITTESALLDTNASELNDEDNLVATKDDFIMDYGGETDGTARLFVRNLPFGCTEDEVSSLFTPFGVLSEVHLPIDKEKRGKGFGFVQFMIPEQATHAMNELDGSSFQGRLLHIIFAKDKSTSADGDGDDKDGKSSRLSSYQQKKEKDRKSMAGMKDSWNASYVRSDTVVATLAEKYGVRSGDVLDATESAGELAVRLAVGEVQVVTENREYLLQHGVNLQALESATAKSSRGADQRSSTTLLIKNLPHDSNEEELSGMFACFGAISQFVMPPSRAVAIIDFAEPTEARAAFKGLAYRKYKHVPLYLEWAPLNVIDKAYATVPSPLLKQKQGEDSGASKDKSATIDDDGDYSSLFIKNLSFNTTEEKLLNHISNAGGGSGLRSVKISTKIKGSTKLSMGFGFVEYATSSLAQAAMAQLHDSNLDGHSLEVKPSDKRLTVQMSSSTSTKNSSNDGVLKTNKLVVRNVAFQATQTEIRALFSTFGSVKRVRIPWKLGGAHRGFAFVELSSHQEALNAMNSLASSHLYGRHLVIEWAKPEDDEADMTLLRKKAKSDEQVVGYNAKRQKSQGGGNEFDDVPDMHDVM